MNLNYWSKYYFLSYKIQVGTYLKQSNFYSVKLPKCEHGNLKSACLASRLCEKFPVHELRKRVTGGALARSALWHDRLKLIEKRNLAKEDGFRQWHFKKWHQNCPWFTRSKLNLDLLQLLITLPYLHFIKNKYLDARHLL